MARVAAAEVASELAQAMIRLRSLLRSESAPSGGLPWTQLNTLARIVDGGPITAAELAASEHVRPQSMHETVAALRADGLVQADPHPSDGRKLLITVTDEGRALMERIPALRQAWLSTAMEGYLTAEETATLQAAAELMNRLADCDTSPAALLARRA